MNRELHEYEKGSCYNTSPAIFEKAEGVLSFDGTPKSRWAACLRGSGRIVYCRVLLYGSYCIARPLPARSQQATTTTTTTTSQKKGFSHGRRPGHGHNDDSTNFFRNSARKGDVANASPEAIVIQSKILL